MKLPALTALVALALSTLATSPGSAAQPVVAVLPLAAADPNMPYGLLPSAAELKIMTTQLTSGLRASGVPLVRQKMMAPAVSAAGFDQTTPIRACVEAECARRIGRSVHADAVVMGAVTRAMAVIWGTDLSIVDVRTGKVLGEMNVGYKGDVQSMERGEWDAGGCLARLLENKKACANDPGW
jgi:hypothetical protein